MTAVNPRGKQAAWPQSEPGNFKAFYKATAHNTFNIAWRVTAGDEHVAKDATQDAYFVMFLRWKERRCRSFDDNSRYVVGIAVRKVADWYRCQRRLTGLDDEHDWGTEDPRFDDVLDELSVLQAARDLIARQPVQRRAVGLLFFLQHCHYAEIAEALGITQSTVRTHVQRLRVQLRPLVDQTNRGGERS